MALALHSGGDSRHRHWDHHFFYLTDWPSQARWLPQDEQEWLMNELRAEDKRKKKIRDHTIVQAFCDRTSSSS